MTFQGACSRSHVLPGLSGLLSGLSGCRVVGVVGVSGCCRDYVGFLRRVVEPGLKLPGRFRNLAVLRVFLLTEDLPALRQYLIPNLGKIPQSVGKCVSLIMGDATCTAHQECVWRERGDVRNDTD